MRERGGNKGRVYCSFLTSVLLLFLPAYGFGQVVAQQDLTELQRILEQHGWRVENSLSGDLILSRSSQPEVISRSDAKSETVPSTETVSATDIQTLRDKLKERGWHVRMDKDGSMFAYPQANEKSAPAAEVTGNETPGETRIDEIQVLLKASGWEATRNSEGDLLLYPQQQQNPPDKRATVTIAPSDLAAAREVLSNAGWRLQEGEKGDLLLYPQPDKVNGDDRRERAGAAERPVESAREARLLAEIWIAEKGESALVVGKIRKVKWVYLVSIVEKSPPFRLHNQLAVRSNDGRIISLLR